MFQLKNKQHTKEFQESGKFLETFLWTISLVTLKRETTRHSLNYFYHTLAFISQVDVSILVPKIENMNIIGTKWVFRNKMNNLRGITRNKARLVAKCYNQEEGICWTRCFDVSKSKMNAWRPWCWLCVCV